MMRPKIKVWLQRLVGLTPLDLTPYSRNEAMRALLGAEWIWQATERWRNRAR